MRSNSTASVTSTGSAASAGLAAKMPSVEESQDDSQVRATYLQHSYFDITIVGI